MDDLAPGVAGGLQPGNPDVGNRFPEERLDDFCRIVASHEGLGAQNMMAAACHDAHATEAVCFNQPRLRRSGLRRIRLTVMRMATLLLLFGPGPR